VLPLALALLGGASQAQPSPPEPSSPQPTLPQPSPGLSIGSSILGGGAGSGKQAKPLVVRRKAARVKTHRHHLARVDADEVLDRPALAGVELLAPLPHPPQPRHIVVPVPAYPLENFVTFYTEPPPPVICHRTPRDPDAPDPHLLDERTVVCKPDNP